jgi:hypothetical protein
MICYIVALDGHILCRRLTTALQHCFLFRQGPLDQSFLELPSVRHTAMEAITVTLTGHNRWVGQG